MELNHYREAILGVIVGDALGLPVQFENRAEILSRPQGQVTGMEGHGAFDMPEGTWSDDSSLTLATYLSIKKKGFVDPTDIAENFERWFFKGSFTPFGQAFDIGETCAGAIMRFSKSRDVNTCGSVHSNNNGNGSLMRIMPVCIYWVNRELCEEDFSINEAIASIETISGITHNHMRSKIACVMYYFMTRNILLNPNQPLISSLQAAVFEAREFFDRDFMTKADLYNYSRLFDLDSFSKIPSSEIKSSGYVVDTLEAVVWSLITTNSYTECLLKAVNLGEDTDTIGAIAGGLAALFYGLDSIPKEWIDTLQNRSWLMLILKKDEFSTSYKRSDDEIKYGNLKECFWATADKSVPTEEDIAHDKELLDKFKTEYSLEIDRTTLVYKTALKEERTSTAASDIKRWQDTLDALEKDDVFRHRMMKHLSGDKLAAYTFLAPYWQNAEECVGRSVYPLYCNFCRKNITLAEIPGVNICPDCGTIWHFDLYFD